VKTIPINLRTANEFVAKYHRHNLPVLGCKFAIGLEDNGSLVGVAIAGRPLARLLDNGSTLEVLRVCTDGTRNANSILYDIRGRDTAVANAPTCFEGKPKFNGTSTV